MSTELAGEVAIDLLHLAIDVLNVESAEKLAERFRRICAPNTSDELHHRNGLFVHLRRDKCERSALLDCAHLFQSRFLLCLKSAKLVFTRG